jgi:hypothetical protein
LSTPRATAIVFEISFACVWYWILNIEVSWSSETAQSTACPGFYELYSPTGFRLSTSAASSPISKIWLNSELGWPCTRRYLGSFWTRLVAINYITKLPSQNSLNGPDIAYRKLAIGRLLDFCHRLTVTCYMILGFLKRKDGTPSLKYFVKYSSTYTIPWHQHHLWEKSEFFRWLSSYVTYTDIDNVCIGD